MKSPDPGNLLRVFMIATLLGMLLTGCRKSVADEQDQKITAINRRLDRVYELLKDFDIIGREEGKRRFSEAVDQTKSIHGSLQAFDANKLSRSQMDTIKGLMDRQVTQAKRVVAFGKRPTE